MDFYFLTIKLSSNSQVKIFSSRFDLIKKILNYFCRLNFELNKLKYVFLLTNCKIMPWIAYKSMDMDLKNICLRKIEKLIFLQNNDV